MTAGCLQALRQDVVLLGGGEAGMSQHLMGIADMHRIIDGDRGCRGITEPVRRDAAPEGFSVRMADLFHDRR